jgi:hypothetical protein
MDYFFWHKTFGTNVFLSIQGGGQNNIKIKTWGNKEFYLRPEIMVIKISRAFTNKV